MKTTVAELREILKPVPDDFEVWINIPCKVGKDFVDVEKGIADTKTMASRRMVMLNAAILDLNPR